MKENGIINFILQLNTDFDVFVRRKYIQNFTVDHAAHYLGNKQCCPNKCILHLHIKKSFLNYH